MHADITHSQAAAAHNCATGMAVDLFRRMIQARWCGGEINLPKAGVLRRFIAASHSAVILRCSPPLAKDGPQAPAAILRDAAKRPLLRRRWCLGSRSRNQRVADETSSSSTPSSVSMSASPAGRGAAAMAGSTMTAQCSGTLTWLRSNP
jgi:hypothetical protein